MCRKVCLGAPKRDGKQFSIDPEAVVNQTAIDIT